jgi:hydrogenase large subunit
MSKVIVDPITRIEGHLHIETDVDHDGTITGAYSSGTMFRGIETILQGRDPRDAWAFTQRICGVCTIVHAMASIRAVENALHYPIPKNARLIRNILSGVQMVQDQVVHFYQLTSPDWMDVVSAYGADPAKAASLQQCMSTWENNSTEYFTTIQGALKKFVDAGQLGIFGNAYWGHPAYKLPPELNLILFAHYLEALDWQRKMVKIHAIFGGKNPHPQFVIGGIPGALSSGIDPISGKFGLVNGNTATDKNRLNLIDSTITAMNDFVNRVHLPDILAVARFYPEWFTLGDGLGNLLSFGDYPQDDNPSWGRTLPKLAVPRGTILWPRDHQGNRLEFKQFRLSDAVYPVDLNKTNEIQEFVSSSWLDYQKVGKTQRYHDGGGLHPYEGETTPNYTGPTQAYAPHTPICEGGEPLYNPARGPEYSWLKTPRWKGNAMEVGPLARVMLMYAKGDAAAVELVNQSLMQIKQPLSGMFSTFGRLLAEGLDTKLIGDMTRTWFNELVTHINSNAPDAHETHNADLFDPSTWPTEASGVGYTEAPRGALGHWVTIKNGLIENYQCVVPTTWNAAPRDPDGHPSAYEAALQDGKHKLAIQDQPLEILRTIHSFNPCMACAVHVINTEEQETLRVTVEE